MDYHHYLANYEIEREIGQGSFATVYLGHEKLTNVKVAIKAVNTAKLNKKLAENLAGEITILKEINHPNIIKLYEIQKTEDFIYLVMEYCEAGDLSQYLRKRHILQESEARHLLSQLVNALKVLWDNNLIHRDLKPQNLLLQRTENDTQFCLKIADFGFARYMEPTDLAETLCGSPLYMAPEILRYEKYDAKADLWSVGAIAYEMLFGSPPYRAENHVQLLRVIETSDDSALPFPTSIKINKPFYNTKFASSKKYTSTTIEIESSDLFREFLLKLLRKNPHDRISFEQFFEHSLVREGISMPDCQHDLIHIPETKIENESILKTSPLKASGSLESVIETVLKISEDDNSTSILELFDNLDRKPAIFQTLRKYFSLITVLESMISSESNQSLTLSISRSGLSEQRRLKYQSSIILLYHCIDILENCLDILKTVLKREPEKGTTEFGLILKAARNISQKLDCQYELLDSLKHSATKGTLHSNSTSSSSMARSNSSQSVAEEASNQTQAVKLQRIETLIFHAACREAKEGGIQELLEQQDVAHSKYINSIVLFSSLLNPNEFSPLTSKFAKIILSGTQETIINRYISLIKDRIK